jgi:hypothetical protein
MTVMASASPVAFVREGRWLLCRNAILDTVKQGQRYQLPLPLMISKSTSFDEIYSAMADSSDLEASILHPLVCNLNKPVFHKTTTCWGASKSPYYADIGNYVVI